MRDFIDLQRFSYIFAAFTLGLCACQTTTPELITVNTVEQNFELVPWQSLSEDGSEFQIIIRSAKAETCINSKMEANMTLEVPNLDIDLIGNQTTGDCIDGISFPEKTFDLGPIQNEINISIAQPAEDTTFASAHIEAETFDITLDASAINVFLEKQRIRRIKGRYFWGFIYGAPSSDLAQIKESLNTTMEVSTTPSGALPQNGYYGYFELSDDALDIIHMPSDAIPFLLAEDAVQANLKWNALQDLLLESVGKFPDLKFSFTSFSGDEIRNF